MRACNSHRLTAEVRDSCQKYSKSQNFSLFEQTKKYNL